jgi:outer membrane receptor for ferrienterochelin and colicin
LNSSGLPYAEEGNPLLKPASSKSATFSLSWLQPEMSAQLLGFHHDIDNFIIDQARTLTYQGQDFSSLRRTNEGKASINGLQASYEWQLPVDTTWFEQARLSANVTRITKAELQTSFDEDIFNIEGVSDLTSNLRLLLRDSFWQGAVNINYRSDFLEHRNLTNNADTYVEAFTSIDLSVSWLYSTKMSLTLDVFNVGNEVLTRTARTENASSLMKKEEFGRRFVLSLLLSL